MEAIQYQDVALALLPDQSILGIMGLHIMMNAINHGIVTDQICSAKEGFHQPLIDLDKIYFDNGVDVIKTVPHIQTYHGTIQ